MEPLSPPPTDPLRSGWLVAFAVVVAAHLALLLTDPPTDSTRWWLTLATKCLIAPLLAVWVYRQQGPAVIVLALALCFLGDLFLAFDATFLLGMAAFAAAHGCFVTFFVRRGAAARLRERPWIVVALLAVAVALVAWVWSGLEPDLRIPVVAYALLLGATAATALAVDTRAGVGGLLFLFSDALIALGIADRLPEDSVPRSFTVMLTYSLALFFLATAIVTKETRTRAFGGPDPTRATDCWPTVPTGERS